MRHSDERATDDLPVAFKLVGLNEAADPYTHHCYSMRRRYRAQAAKPLRSPIDCKIWETHMKFMVSWTVPQGTFNAAVARFLETGGAPPEGVKMLGRWHSLNGHGFAISESSDPKAMYRWVTQWADLLPLTVSPCLEDADAGEVMASLPKR
jgi:Protein of unknown function (DUF3303)